MQGLRIVVRILRDPDDPEDFQLSARELLGLRIAALLRQNFCKRRNEHRHLHAEFAQGLEPRQQRRVQAAGPKLPELLRTVAALERRIAALEAAQARAPDETEHG